MTRAEKIALITAIGTGEANTALEFRTLLTALLDPPTGTIVTKDVTNAYITANFDGTGLGINEEIGYAICNGANGTRDHNGKVMVAYGTLYPTMGASGGASAHALSVNEMPQHNHGIKYQTHNAAGSGSERTLDNSGSAINANTTEYAGGGVAHNNMQPYIVSLVTMKL